MKEQINFIKNVQFNTDILSYRGIQWEDSEQLVKWRSHSYIYEYSGQSRPITIEEHKKWFEGYKDNTNEIRLIFKEKDNKKDMGLIGGRYEDGICTLSYYIGESEFLGKGYAGMAIKDFMNYVHDNFDIANFNAYIHTDNGASIACIKKCGFQQQSLMGDQLIFIYNY